MRKLFVLLLLLGLTYAQVIAGVDGSASVGQQTSWQGGRQTGNQGGFFGFNPFFMLSGLVDDGLGAVQQGIGMGRNAIKTGLGMGSEIVNMGQQMIEVPVRETLGGMISSNGGRGDMIGSIQRPIQDSISGGIKAGRQGLTAAQQGIGKGLNAGQQGLNTGLGAAQQGVNAVREGVGKGVDTAKQVVGQGMGAGKKAFNQGANAAKNGIYQVSGMADGLPGNDIFKGAGQHASDFVDTAREQANNDLDQGEGVIDSVLNIAPRITRQTSNEPDIKEQVHKKLKELQQLVNKNKQEHTSYVMGLLDKLKDKVNRGRGQGEKQVEDAIDQVQPQVRITRVLH